MSVRTHDVQALIDYIAANVRRLRERKGVTQQELAELAGFEVRFLQRVERGRLDLRLSSLGRLAAALGIPPTALLRPAKKQPPKAGRPKKRGSRQADYPYFVIVPPKFWA